MELSATLEELRRNVNDRATEHMTTVTLAGNDVEPHECDDGWIYEDEGAKECPVCMAIDDRATLARRLSTSGVASRYLDVTWDDLEILEPLPAIKAACERIRDILRSGHNAVFAGPPGSGKTQAAILLARAAADLPTGVAIENIGRAAMRIRSDYGRDGETEADVVRRLSDVNLLVLDDVGAGEAGEGKLELRLLYFITEARQSARKPTVITTNLDAKGLREFLGARVANRLMPLEVFAFTHGRNFRTPAGGTAWR